MRLDPNEIVAQLIEAHGVDGALRAAIEATAAAHRDNDNYRLSVWRDVKRILAGRLQSAA